MLLVRLASLETALLNLIRASHDELKVLLLPLLHPRTGVNKIFLQLNIETAACLVDPVSFICSMPATTSSDTTGYFTDKRHD